MKLSNKICSVLAQFAMLPLSALTSALGGLLFYYILIMVLVTINSGTSGDDLAASIVFGGIGALILQMIGYVIAECLMMFPGNLKRKDFSPIIVGEEYTYEETVEHDIKLTDGTIIGSYETTETKTGYDLSGEDFLDIIVHWFLYVMVLPLRIISLLMSIISLFTNKFFVCIKTPKLPHGKTFNEFLHTYLDVVIIKDSQ